MTTGYISYILGTSKENQIKRSQTKQMQAKVIINRHQVAANKSAKANQPCISKEPTEESLMLEKLSSQAKLSWFKILITPCVPGQIHG